MKSILKKGMKRLLASAMSVVFLLQTLNFSAFALEDYGIPFTSTGANTYKLSTADYDSVNSLGVSLKYQLLRVFPATLDAVHATSNAEACDRYKYQSYSMYFCPNNDSVLQELINNCKAQDTGSVYAYFSNKKYVDDTTGGSENAGYEGGQVKNISPSLVDTSLYSDNSFVSYIKNVIDNKDMMVDAVGFDIQKEFNSLCNFDSTAGASGKDLDGNSNKRDAFLTDYKNLLEKVHGKAAVEAVDEIISDTSDSSLCLVFEPLCVYVYTGDLSETSVNAKYVFLTTFQQLWINYYGHIDDSVMKPASAYFPFKKADATGFGGLAYLNSWTGDGFTVTNIQLPSYLSQYAYEDTGEGVVSKNKEVSTFYWLNLQANFGFYGSGSIIPKAYLATFMPLKGDKNYATPKEAYENDELASITGGWSYLKMGSFSDYDKISINEYRVMYGIDDSSGTINTGAVVFDDRTTLRNNLNNLLRDGFKYDEPNEEKIDSIGSVDSFSTSSKTLDTRYSINGGIRNSFWLDTLAFTKDKPLDDALLSDAETCINSGKSVESVTSSVDDTWGGLGSTTTVSDTYKTMVETRSATNSASTATDLTVSSETAKISDVFDNGMEVVPYTKYNSYLENPKYKTEINRTGKTDCSNYNPHQPYSISLSSAVAKNTTTYETEYQLAKTKKAILRGYEIWYHATDKDGNAVVGSYDSPIKLSIADCATYYGASVDPAKGGSFDLTKWITSKNSPFGEDGYYYTVDVRAIYTYEGTTDKPEFEPGKGYILEVELPEYMLQDEYDDFDVTSNYKEGNTIGTSWTGDNRGHDVKYKYIEKLYRPTKALADFQASEEEGGALTKETWLNSTGINSLERAIKNGRSWDPFSSTNAANWNDITFGFYKYNSTKIEDYGYETDDGEVWIWNVSESGSDCPIYTITYEDEDGNEYTLDIDDLSVVADNIEIDVDDFSLVSVDVTLKRDENKPILVYVNSESYDDSAAEHLFAAINDISSVHRHDLFIDEEAFPEDWSDKAIFEEAEDIDWWYNEYGTNNRTYITGGLVYVYNDALGGGSSAKEDDTGYLDQYNYVEEYADKVTRNGGTAAVDMPLQLVSTTTPEYTVKMQSAIVSNTGVVVSIDNTNYPKYNLNNATVTSADLSTFRTKYTEKVDKVDDATNDYFDPNGVYNEASRDIPLNTIGDGTTSVQNGVFINIALNKKGIIDSFKTTNTNDVFGTKLASWVTTDTKLNTLNTNSSVSSSTLEKGSKSTKSRLDERLFYICYIMNLANHKKDVTVNVDWKVKANSGNPFNTEAEGVETYTEASNNGEYTLSESNQGRGTIVDFSSDTSEEVKKTNYTAPSTLPIQVTVGLYAPSSSRPVWDKLKEIPVKSDDGRLLDPNVETGASSTDSTQVYDHSFTQRYIKGELSVIPEVPMGYGYLDASNNYVYVKNIFAAGTVPRKIAGMVYNTISLHLDTNTRVTGTAMAADSRANSLRQEMTNHKIPVFYSGSEVTIAVQPKNSTMNVESYCLGFASGATLPSGSTYDAGEVHQEWLDMFKTKKATKDGVVDVYTVQLTPGMQVGSNKIYGQTMDNDLTPDTIGVEEEYRLLIGRNGNKAVILNLDKPYYIDTDGTIKQGTSSTATVKFPSLSAIKDVITNDNKLALDNIIEAQFEEGTGQKLGYILTDKYTETGTAIADAKAKTYDPYVQRSAEKFVENYGALGVKMEEGWYTEVCTVLAIKKYTTTFKITMSGIYTDKIPISWAPKSPTDKNKLFSEGIFGYGIVKLNLTKLNKEFTMRNAGRPDFIISDANIHDMKFGY